MGAGARTFDLAEVARTGAFVSIGHDGALSVERGFVRPADEPLAPEAENGAAPVGPDAEGEPSSPGSVAPAAARTDDGAVLHGAPISEEEEPDDGGRLPERLVTELTAHRTLALRAALSSDPDVALLALLHALVLRAFYAGAPETCLEVDARSAGLAGLAPGLGDAVPARTLAEHHAHWQGLLPQHARDLWPALVGLDADSRAALLAVCVGRSVNALVQPWDRRSGAVAHADRLATHLGLDMAAAERIAALRKPEIAERLLCGTGWLPAPLRTPGLTPTGAEPDRAGADDGAAAGTDGEAVREAEGDPVAVDALGGAPVAGEVRDTTLSAAE